MTSLKKAFLSLPCTKSKSSKTNNITVRTAQCNTHSITADQHRLHKQKRQCPMTAGGLQRHTNSGLLVKGCLLAAATCT
jgi:hypothetical protein